MVLAGTMVKVWTYVELILRNILESARVRLEVLGQNADRGPREHLRHQERLVLTERSVVKDQQELDPLVERLDVVRHPGREEPHVTGADIIDKARAARVDRRHPHAALEDQRPLVGRVPVQLAVRVRTQAHVDARHGRGAGEHVLVLLACPAGAGLGALPVVRQAERPHGLRDGAAVGARDRVQVRVEALVVVRPRARVGRAVAAPDGLRGLDAVEVQVQAQLAVRGLPGDVLRVADHGRVGLGARVGLRRPAAEQVLAAVQRAGRGADGWRGRVDAADHARVLAVVSHSESDVSILGNGGFSKESGKRLTEERVLLGRRASPEAGQTQRGRPVRTWCQDVLGKFSDRQVILFAAGGDTGSGRIAWSNKRVRKTRFNEGMVIFILSEVTAYPDTTYGVDRPAYPWSRPTLWRNNHAEQALHPGRHRRHTTVWSDSSEGEWCTSRLANTEHHGHGPYLGRRRGICACVYCVHVDGKGTATCSSIDQRGMGTPLSSVPGFIRKSLLYGKGNIRAIQLQWFSGQLVLPGALCRAGAIEYGPA